MVIVSIDIDREQIDLALHKTTNERVNVIAHYERVRDRQAIALDNRIEP